jgi:GGDEF domain-containing protein
VLLCLAQRLLEDAGDNQFVARVGGEEFAVLFRSTTMDWAVERMTATLKRVATRARASTTRSSVPTARSTRPSAVARTAQWAAARACSRSCRGRRARPLRPSRARRRPQRQRNSFTDSVKVATV